MKNIFKLNNVKIFVAALAFCGAALLGYNAYSNATMTPEERLFQQNLEALTNAEASEVGTCGFYVWTGDTIISDCNISKQEALSNYNHWNGTSDRAWCCESCSSTSYCGGTYN